MKATQPKPTFTNITRFPDSAIVRTVRIAPAARPESFPEGDIIGKIVKKLMEIEAIDPDVLDYISSYINGAHAGTISAAKY